MSTDHHSESLKELATALSKSQGMMGNAVKDSTNPHFQSSYADLASVREAVREPFAANGLAATQVVARDDQGGLVLRTLLLHSSGEWLASDFPLLGDLTRPQVLGSLLTYARRYSLAAIAGIAQDDDDGNAAQQHADTRPARTAPPERREMPKPGPPKQPKPDYRAWLDSFCADINGKWAKAHPDTKPLVTEFQINKHLIKHMGEPLAKSEATNFANGARLWETRSGLMADEAITYCRAEAQKALAKLKPAPAREPGADDGGDA